VEACYQLTLKPKMSQPISSAPGRTPCIGGSVKPGLAQRIEASSTSVR
jgi:hypothetical protein